MKKKFERTWCDYLTKCQKFPNIEVGSYECTQCKFHKSSKEDNFTKREIGDYERYFEKVKGEVECECNE